MIAIGSDHGGFPLKRDIIGFLEARGLEYRDFGTLSGDSCDYPEYAEAVARAVARGEYSLGILICGTGVGVSIAANKVDGIRAALCHDCYSAEMARRHNDANILALGARVTASGLAEKITGIFLETGFDGGRHARRVAMLDAIKPRAASEAQV